jgi:ABC-2 type transport system permease protein
VMVPLVDLSVKWPLLLVFDVFAASLMLSLLGILGAIWAEKFDHIAAVTNFVITPLSFLSGTFYSISALPEPFHLIALANPFFYMIDLIRFSMTGHHDGPVVLGVFILVAANLALWHFALHLLRIGYRLKA